MSFQYPSQGDSDSLFGVNINWFWYILGTNQELRSVVKVFLSNPSVLISWDMSLMSHSFTAKFV